MTDLHSDGGFADYIGRPLGQVAIPPSYNIVFFEKTLDASLNSMQITSLTSTIVFNEEMGKPNVKYGRVLHYYITDRATGEIIAGPRYVPYIDSWSTSGEVTTYNIKPLVEVINPRFVKASDTVFMSYFFSNFTTHRLPNNEYTDNPKYLRRLIEFSNNNVNRVFSSSSSSFPIPNDRNYAIDSAPEDTTPRIAFLSSVMRIFVVQLVENGSSSSSPIQTIAVLFEEPNILTWVGHRFALDFHPPMLVNKIQELKWAGSDLSSSSSYPLKELSNHLNQDAVNDSPPREVPYHHVVSGLEAIMYPGYGGLNFNTKPINDVYDVALDHIFQVEGKYEKIFDIYNNSERTNRKIRSIGVKQINEETITLGSVISGKAYTSDNTGGNAPPPYLPSRIADGDVNTYINGFSYIIVDLGEGNERTLRYAKVYLPDHTARIYVGVMYFYGSNISNSGPWTRISDRIYPSMPEGYPGWSDYITVNNNTAYRYYRLYSNLYGNQTRRQINEWQLFEDLPNFTCRNCDGSSSSCAGPEYTITTSGFSPAQRHFAVFQINMDDFRGFGGSSSSSSSSSSSDYIYNYDVIVPGALDPTTSDKPYWWPFYWEECGSPASSSGGVGGIIRVEYDENKLKWYGEMCINGVVLYATIEYKPFGYLGEPYEKYWLTIGVKTSFNVALDLLWQGYLLKYGNAIGEFKRFWALAENAPDTITVEVV